MLTNHLSSSFSFALRRAHLCARSAYPRSCGLNVERGGTRSLVLGLRIYHPYNCGLARSKIKTADPLPCNLASSEMNQ